MVIVVGLGQKPKIDFEIKGFHQTALGFRLAGVIRYLGQVTFGFVAKDVPQFGIGAAGGIKMNIRIDFHQAGDKGFQTGFVGNADKHPFDCDPFVDVLHHVNGHCLLLYSFHQG